MVNLKKIAKNVRSIQLDMHFNAGDSHIGCSMSVVEILVALYFEVMKIDPRDPLSPDRDRFILSKGHAASALYAVLSERGFFPREDLFSFAKNGSHIASHVERDAFSGVETNGGSGGHGLSLGIGIALASIVDQRNFRTFVLMGDGELQEGSIWEAAMFASSRKFSALTLIIDRNEFQTWSKVDDVVAIGSIHDKFRSFGWEADEVDGHNMTELAEVLNKASDRPRVVIAHTIKGKGISFMEGNGKWHNGVLSEDEYKLAKEEINHA